MDSLLAWFDLNQSGPVLGVASADAATLSLPHQLLLYAVVVAGVLLSESVAMARRSEPITLDLSWPWVATACLIALIVFPAVWREIGAMPQASLIAQLGLAAQGGVFWGVLLAGAEKHVHGRTATAVIPGDEASGQGSASDAGA